MDRRVILIWVAPSSLCGCTPFFGLDGLDESGNAASLDAGDTAGDVNAAISSADAEGRDTSDANAALSSVDAEGGDTSVFGGTDSNVEASLSGSDAGRADATMPTDSGAPVDAARDLDVAPAGYAGTPFKRLTIPGTIYLADYDQGGAGVAFCYDGGASGAACGAGITLTDWCCGAKSGCDERAQPAVCPTYRGNSDNAGLCHMNQGEPDDYAANGPSWAPTAEGPTLTGPMVKAGTPVPEDSNTTTEPDVYLCHTEESEWVKYTVQVLEAGQYTVGGFMAVASPTTISLDFGNGITTARFTQPTSPCTWTGCMPFHSWAIVSNLATVTFPTAGTYVMTFTIVSSMVNQNYFTFTKI
jgi:hypothetical protein